MATASIRAAVGKGSAASTGAQLAPGIVRVARREGESKAARNSVGLVVAWRVEALRLDRGVGRDRAIERCEAVAGFEPPAVALRVEVSGQVIADGDAVGR